MLQRYKRSPIAPVPRARSRGRSHRSTSPCRRRSGRDRSPGRTRAARHHHLRRRQALRQLLNGPERISSNILADRLATLVGHGLLTRSHDPSHKQKITYSLTEQAIELVPVLAQLIAWGMQHLPVADQYAARGEVLVAGGPPLWEAFMDELRETHLGPAARQQHPPTGPTVTAQLQAAYESALPH
jgi:DNA-binding HxlR family transcriptional regulator